MPEPTPTPSPTPAPAVVPITAAQVTASTSDTNVAANAVDGDLNTRWSGYGDGAWIELDLGGVARVSELRLAVHGGATRSNRFDVEVSSDRVRWTAVARGLSSALTTGLQSVSLFGRYARYVRYVGHGHVTSTGTTGLWNSLAEVQVLSSQRRAQPAPQTLTASTLYDGGAILLQWSAVPAASYRVYRRDATNDWSLITTTSQLSYFNFGLLDGVRYCYGVSSVLGLPITESFLSTEACAVGSVMPLPLPPPTNLVAQHGLAACDGSVTTPLRLSWNAAPGATSYGVWKAAAQTGPYTKVADVTATTHSIATVGAAFYAVTSANGNRTSVLSAAVFGTFAIPGCPAPMNLTPRAEGVSASGHDGNVPANAVDGNLQTRWSAAGDGAWLQLDLGAVRTVTMAQIAVHRGNERQNRFEIQISNDRQTWTTLFSGLSPQSTTALQTIDLVDRPGRYVRYLGHGTTDPLSASWNSVSELRIFGY